MPPERKDKEETASLKASLTCRGSATGVRSSIESRIEAYAICEEVCTTLILPWQTESSVR